jgi:hypothetical protein
MAEVLGFEIQGLTETGPSDQLLPLDAPEESGGEPAFADPAPASGGEPVH